MSRLTVKEFKDLLDKKILVYDGAMGTNLQAQHLGLDAFGGLEGCSEALNLFTPEAVKKVHVDFLNAGCQVIETNTFGGTRITLKEYGLEDKVAEISTKGVNIAKEAIKEADKDYPCYIAASMGPTSALPTLGNISFDDMADAFYEQMVALWEAGVDLFQIETCQDLLQIKSALYAANKLFEEKDDRCPVVVSVTLEATGTMLVGSDISAVTAVLEPYDFVDMVCINCATGPLEMVRHVEYLTRYWPRAVGVMPNAGLPENVDGKAVYKMTAEEFSTFQEKFVKEYGVNMVGGCCGTSAEHLKAVVEKVKDFTPLKREITIKGRVASMFNAVNLDQDPAPALIAERTNANGAKKFREYLLADDWDHLTGMGREQAKGGAHLIDLCVAYVGRDEIADFKKLVPMFATNVKLPLVIDSTNPEAVEAALKCHGGRCVINSVNLEDGGAKLGQIAKMAKKFGAALICLTIDEEGMAKTAERKLEVAHRIHKILTSEYNFKDCDLIFDTLTFTVGSGDAELRESANETLKAIARIKEELPETHTLLGVSNISFGLNPAAREILNSLFLEAAVKAGLSTAIVNPAKIIPTFKIPEEERKLAEDLLFNKIGDGSELKLFLKAFEGKNKKKRTVDIESLAPDKQLYEKVVEGDATKLEDLTTKLLETFKPGEIINGILLEAMKLVGQLFGSGQLQLPFVLQSAEVVKRTVKLLEPFMEKKEIDPGKKMILATVAGDVHDIGKNLVNIMLSNNGYYVKDLGIKVDIDTMIHAAEEEGASVIGMSGLLVRSTQVMKENLQELNRRGLTPSIILGGAALTREYVEKDLGSIYDGKVFYAEDAIDGLKIMEKLTGEKSKKTEVSPQDPSNTEPAKASRKVETIDPSVLGAANRHQFVKSEEIIKPPFYANHYLEIDSTSLFQMMSHKVLFEARWGYKKNYLSDEEYKELLENEARPMLHKFIEMDRAEEILQTKGVYGYYRCRAKGNTVRILDDAGICIGEFEFPRQKNPPHLCISDFFSDSEDDTIALWATTVGSHFAEVEKRIYAEDRFKDYHLLHGMGAELADCGAVYIHRHIHKELFPQITLGQNEPKGVRYSFGYPACPDLEAQKELFRILKAEEIGIKLTESNQMVPELSVSGFIVFNKHGRYFVP